VKMQ